MPGRRRGHGDGSNIATTVDIYGHVGQGAFDEAAARMGRALG
jgi:hypothetical protein